MKAMRLQPGGELFASESGKRHEREAGQVRYWQYGQAENSPDLAISDLSRFLQRIGPGRLAARFGVSYHTIGRRHAQALAVIRG